MKERKEEEEERTDADVHDNTQQQLRLINDDMGAVTQDNQRSNTS